jgi:Putative cyclase.
MNNIHGPNKSDVNGIHGMLFLMSLKQTKERTKSSVLAWCEKGIVGRGVLLDYHRWRLANNIPAEIFKTHPIPVEHLKAVAEYQQTEIEFGDILIIRVGESPSSKSKSGLAAQYR